MIVGICGKAGSGKDTLAAMLVKRERFVRIGLADPIKRICRDVFGFSHEQLFGPSELRNAPDPRYLHRGRGSEGSRILAFDEKGFAITEPVPVKDEYLTPRHALQQLGTGWGRECHADVWVNKALSEARWVLENGYGYAQDLGSYAPISSAPRTAGVVIPDVRFRNELRAIRAAGGVTLRILREGAGLKGVASQHRSELEMESFKETDFDAVLTNDATIAELEAKVPELMKVLRERAGQSQ